GAGEDVGPQRGAEAHAVLLVDHVEAVDAVDAFEAFGEIVHGAAGGHNLDVVPLGGEVIEDHARAHGVAHALADDAVQDLHRCTARSRRLRAPGRLAAPRSRVARILASARGLMVYAA